MRKLKNVLYVTTAGSSLSVKNRSICIENENGSRTVPVHNVESVVCFGDMTVTTPFMHFCSMNNVKLVFLSCYGKYYGAFYGGQTGNVFLRREQYMRFGKPEKCLCVAKEIISAKIKNSVRVLQKNVSDNAKVKSVCDDLGEILKRVSEVSDIEKLRGLEGIAAEKYFSVFDEMILCDDSEMKFVRRSRRPAENNVNALLSFVYTLLKTDVTAAVESVGLDIQVGVMHTMDYGKPSLVLDMMEEYRAPLCDRFVISLINRRQIVKDDFEIKEGMITLTADARKKVITEWQNRKQNEVENEEVGEKIQTGLIPFVQASVMSEYLRGEREFYRAYLWR